MSQIETTSTHGVLGRVIAGQPNGMTVAAAEYWSSVALPAVEEERLYALAEKNRRGELSGAEQSELAEFAEVVELMDLLKAQALRVLSQHAG